MTRPIQILVVDDDEDTLKVVSSNLAMDGYFVDTFSSPVQAIQKLQEKNYDTVLVDYQMPEMSGLEFIKKVRAVNPDIPVILFTAYASLSSAVEAIKDGAYHYLPKPLNFDELKIVLRNSISFHLLKNSHKRLESEVYKAYNFHNMIGRSKLMKKVFQQVEAFSRSETCVFIRGERGTGKELAAKTIHYNSGRKNAPFVALDCSAGTEASLQNELFGFHKGQDGKISKTGAGKIKEAEGGTLFLKEIDFLSMDMQGRIFSFINEKTFAVPESGEKIKADVRVLAASCGDIEMAVEEKRFHKNLFSILKMFTLSIPSLHERREDIPLLAEQFLKVYAERYSKDIRCLSSALYSKLLSHDFPENVSELERLLERACIVCQSSCMELEDMPELLSESEETGEEAFSSFLKEKQKVVEQFEQDYFSSLLEKTHGRIGDAAKVSGLAERNIYEKLKKYGLKKEDFKNEREA